MAQSVFANEKARQTFLIKNMTKCKKKGLKMQASLEKTWVFFYGAWM